MEENIYKVEKTEKTPNIHFNASTGNFEISGNSIPEHAANFYSPLQKWLDEYIQKPSPITNLTIKLTYFNTTSSKCILDILKKIDVLFDTEESQVTINWLYEEEDEDSRDVGVDFQSVINSTMNIVPY